MHLVSLSISGFKSFAKPTLLTFAPGITAIVGPNGCGKSNVVDALRWVMGEQRTSVLRGERMENVIFNGTVNRKPTGMAEVKIVLNNERGFLSSPYTEIEISRRLHRDLTSEYLLNGHDCRLKDVTDLLHDSGMGPNLYTILELKMVEEILREDGDGRRAMFEEAAGVAKYKIRRRQAQSKLKQTDDDLLRLADILSEVERHVGSLKRQAIRARKYSELAGQLKLAESAAQWNAYRKLLADLTPLEAAIRESSSATESVRAALRLVEARLLELRTSEIEMDKEVTSFRAGLSTIVQSISQLESESSGLRAREHAARETIARAERESILLTQKRESVASRRVEIVANLTAQSIELNEAESNLQSTSAELEATNQRFATIDGQVRNQQEVLHTLRRGFSDAQREHALIAAKVAAALQRRSQIEVDVQSMRADKERLASKLSAIHEELTTAEATVSETVALIDQLQTRRSEHDLAVSLKQEQLRSNMTALDSLTAKADLLRTLAERGPRAETAVRTIRENKIDGVGGLLGDVVDVDEPYRRAFQSILGPVAYYHLVGNEDAALRAIALLRQTETGQATFVTSVDQVNSFSTVLVAPAGSIGTALGLLKSGADSPSLVRFLERVVLVQDWDSALRLTSWAKDNDATVVALDGQWLRGDGAFHGGSSKSNVAVDIGLGKQLDEVERLITERQAVISQVQAEIQRARNDSESLDQEFTRAASLRRQHESNCARIREDRVKIETLLSALTDRESSALALADAVDAEIGDGIGLERGALGEVVRAESELQSAELSTGDGAAQLNEARSDVVRARERNHETERKRDAALHRRELQNAELIRIDESLRDLDESLAGAAQSKIQAVSELETVEIRLKEIESLLLDHWKKRDRLSTTIDTVLQAAQDVKALVAEQENKLREMRSEHEADLEGEQRIALDIARLRGEIDALLHAANTQHGLRLDAEDFTVAHPELIASSYSLEETQELREKIERLGPVNLMAIEEFDAENARLDSMLSQREDLLRAKRTIEETIARINETAQAQFLHTFEAVRCHFQRLFQEFFPAGEADLLLSGSDLLDADITLWANPSGKRLKSLSLMSGGEKTMTAIALLFALYQVKPSPFCVFDEVDAPLDDANIDRFNRVIRMHSENTQFILITHNRRTMEIADNLYGVTMQEEGVSKLVSVRLMSAVA